MTNISLNIRTIPFDKSDYIKYAAYFNAMIMNTNLLPCFLDCEASSLDSDSYPTEIAWSLPDGTIKSMLINPYSQENWTNWSFEAQQITGISRELLRKEGHHPQWVAYTLNTELKNRTLYSDAPDYDDNWIQVLFRAVNSKPEFIIKNIWIAFNEIINDELRMWEAIYDAEQLLGQAHRAAIDVERSLIAYVSVRDIK